MKYGMIIMNDKWVRVWADTVVAYLNILFKHMFGERLRMIGSKPWTPKLFESIVFSVSHLKLLSLAYLNSLTDVSVPR